MRRDDYENLLLEIRQGLKEHEETFKSQACVDLSVFKKVKKMRQVVQQELINYRVGYKRNQDLVHLMGG